MPFGTCSMPLLFSLEQAQDAQQLTFRPDLAHFTVSIRDQNSRGQLNSAVHPKARVAQDDSAAKSASRRQVFIYLPACMFVFGKKFNVDLGQPALLQCEQAFRCA